MKFSRRTPAPGVQVGWIAPGKVVSSIVAARNAAVVDALSCAPKEAAQQGESNSSKANSRTPMVDNPFAELSLERAIGLRWTLRDIQARRLKMSPVSDEDLTALKDLGLIDVRDEGPVLTQAGIAVVNG